MTLTARRGFALMAALALLAIVSIAALDLSTVARPRRLAVAATTERAAATEAAVAGLEHARAIVLRLADPRTVPTRRLTGDADPWALADGMIVGPTAIGQLVYSVELRDAGARLHLNTATDDQLRRLLLALRVDSRRADRLAAAIADWRDGDQLRRANGAERAEYLRAGRAMLPDDGSFADVATLRLVLGMTDSLYQALRPYVTVVGSGHVSLNAAERPVLMTLPGMTEESASLLLRHRLSGQRVTSLDRLGEELSAGARQRWREALPLLASMTVLSTREIHAASSGWQPAGVTHVRLDALLSRDANARVTWRRVER